MTRTTASPVTACPSGGLFAARNPAATRSVGQNR